MSSANREHSRDGERRPIHQHSASSDCGKALVPMWDSSDPDRAPPPLPLNPQSSPSVASRPNTSSVIQAHHAALTEKARENTYVTNLSSPERKRNDASPDRSLMKTATHKRMQSLQTGHVRDLSNFLENGTNSPTRSSEKSPSRPSTPYTIKEVQSEAKSPEKEHERSSSPTPLPRAASMTPVLRPSLRRPQANILGENSSPQSATMVALQNMSSNHADSALSDITNGSVTPSRPQSIDGISTQILCLTGIATNLQKEMAALSRRSKDNATDLVSLKAATNARDEDIRKSLRELVLNINESTSRSSTAYPGSPFLIDNKPHTPNSRGIKTVSLPRIPSPNSFTASLEREAAGAPAPHHQIDGAATIALLEKVLREMGTKEGQELLVGRLTAVADRLAQDGITTAKKLEDLVQYIKDSTSDNRALVAHNGSNRGRINSAATRDFSFGQDPRLEMGFETPGSGPMVSRVEKLLNAANKENRGAPEQSRGADLLNDEILRIIRSVKDSVAQGGGLTAEVKALVRELRGEVLGMGRELGRKLTQASLSEETRGIAGEQDRLSRVVHEGLGELREHMDRIMRESRRRSSESVTSRNTVDGQEVYNAVRAALLDHKASSKDPTLEKEEVIDAVKEAWEDYKPDIELQHFGLEREDLLECLKEGLQQYVPQDSSREIGGATREEVFAAVVEGLKHFSPPPIETQASLSREEILQAVRECLEEFEFPVAASAGSHNADINREDMLDAVKEGLSSFDFLNQSAAVSNRDIDSAMSREDVVEAVKAGLIEHGGFLQDQSMAERLQEIIETIQAEFKAVSDEAKQNVAANGRDTEQVLDSHKDGMEKLRSDIERYVDRAADLDVKDDILDAMRDSFAVLQVEIVKVLSKGTASSVDVIKDELDHIKESMTNSLVPSNTVDRDEILSTLRDGFDSLRADIEQPKDSGESILSGTGEILDALHGGLDGLRAEVEKIAAKPVEPVDMTVNYEILDTLKAGLEGVRADIDRLRETKMNDGEVAAVGSGAVIASEGGAEGLKRNDIENLEVLISQLRIKVEALESMPPPCAQPHPDALSRNDLDPVHEAIRNVQDSVTAISSISPRGADTDSVQKEDFEAIETLLRNTKAKIDEMDPEQAVKKEHLDMVELVIREARDGINDLLSQFSESSRREDVHSVEVLVKEVAKSLEDVKERMVIDEENTEKATKTDIEAVEAVCLDIKAQIEQVLLADLASLASKDDITCLGEMVKDFKERIEFHAENNSKAFEERQAETVGVGERVSEVKIFLEEFKDAVKDKLDEGATGVEALGQILSGLEAKLDQNAIGAKELLETMTTEFEKSHAGVVGSKLESDEQFDKIWTKFEAKFDELVLKYDDAQQAANARTVAEDGKNAASENSLNEMKLLAEELKLLIDSLGTSLTDSAEKMEEASKAVFTRVEDTFTRVEETHADAKAEHQLTREQVIKAINAVEDVGNSVNEYHPKVFESIREILSIVGQHYEHSKTTADVIGEHYQHSKSTADSIQEKFEALPIQSDEAKMTPLLEAAPLVEKYDDAQVHEKLDRLANQMQDAGNLLAQSELLDKIHAQVMDTAAEVSSFVSNQTQRSRNEHDSRAKDLEAETIALERSTAQREAAESSVNHLREEEERLRESVLGLKADRDNLAHRKLQLSRDVSSLETALRIRREELHAMEARAEGLERRILEGVIDHSRAFLMNKNSIGRADRDAMNLKRVPSQAAGTISSIGRQKSVSSTTQSAVNMAMNGNRKALAPPVSKPPSNSRRNFSLNQITNNVPNGGFKRSHSVKTPSGGGVLRKSSWGGSSSGGRKSYGYGELNKENLALKENEDEHSDDYSAAEGSDAETMRRSSGGLGTITGSELTESTIDEGTEWTGTDVDENESVNGNVVLYEEFSSAA